MDFELSKFMTYDEKEHILATEVDILQSYDPDNHVDRIIRMSELVLIGKLDKHLPSHEEIDSYISDLFDLVDLHVSDPNYSHITNTQDTQEKINELETRLTTTSCHPF